MRHRRSPFPQPRDEGRPAVLRGPGEGGVGRQLARRGSWPHRRAGWRAGEGEERGRGEAKPAREAGGRARGARPGGTFQGGQGPGPLIGGTIGEAPSPRGPRHGGRDMAGLGIRQFAERLGWGREGPRRRGDRGRGGGLGRAYWPVGAGSHRGPQVQYIYHQHCGGVSHQERGPAVGRYIYTHAHARSPECLGAGYPPGPPGRGVAPEGTPEGPIT